VKNSRGPTNLDTIVRKCTQRQANGETRFWFDWDRNTAEFLEGLSNTNPIKEVICVTKKNNSSFSCSTLGLKEVEPGEIGKAVMENEELLGNIAKAARWQRVKEFKRLSAEDMATLTEQSNAVYMEMEGGRDFTDVLGGGPAA
jgi:hypothetical protein